jgi:hypothetical protein
VGDGASHFSVSSECIQNTKCICPIMTYTTMVESRLSQELYQMDSVPFRLRRRQACARSSRNCFHWIMYLIQRSPLCQERLCR